MWDEEALYAHDVCLPLFGGELALRPVPRSKEEVDEYEADLVVSLYQDSSAGHFDWEMWKDVNHLSVPLGSVSHTVGRKGTLRVKDWHSLVTSVFVVLHCLKRGLSVVVHCRVGLHRTGFLAYLVCRVGGQSQLEALSSLRQMRPLASEEMTLRNKNRPQSTLPKAEEAAQRVLEVNGMSSPRR